MNWKYILILFTILLLIISCTKVEKVEPDVKALESELQKKAPDDQINFREQQLETLRNEAQDLLDSLRAKELMLVVKEAKLDSISNVLDNREVTLKKQELTLKKMRSSAYLIMFIGIVLSIFGVFLLLKPKKSPPEKPVEKPLTKADEKTVKQPKSDVKEGEKPVGESVAVKEEPKKTGKSAAPAKKETPKKEEQIKAKPVKKEPTKPTTKKTTAKKPPAKDTGKQKE